MRHRARGTGGNPSGRYVNRIARPLVLMLVLAAGCTARTADPSPPPVPPPFAACAALVAPPSGAPASGTARPPADAAPAGSNAAGSNAAGSTAAAATPATAAGGQLGRPLPDVRLPCLAGGAPVRLTDLRGPAVINLWASWCGPCRRELPALQRFADRAAGRVHVLGVVTRDAPARAASLATDLGVSFPAVDDPEQRLLRDVRGPGLPTTVLLDRDGHIRYVQPGQEMDGPELARLVREHLAVTVPS